MQISLKNASILADDILGKVSRTTLKTTASVSAYDETDAEGIATVLDAARQDLRKRLETGLTLVRTAYAIRARLGTANVESGVASRLTKRAELSKEADVIRTALGIQGPDDGYGRAPVSPEADPDPKTVAARLAALKTRLATPGITGVVSDVVTLGFASVLREEYEDRLSVIDREKRVLAAEIAGINSSARIDITDDEEKVLKDARLL